MLILAGEAIFVLPFIVTRVFRPSYLDVFSLNNVELGVCFSVYGVVALCSYLFGGPLADKYKPRKLMSIALLLTALGGFYLTLKPSFLMLTILYGYWGFTTILLFWAPMIKAARIWGGSTAQGKAFGLLDGGRGLVAALFASLGVFIFSIVDMPTSSTMEHEALLYVIFASSILVALVGVLVFCFLKKIDQKTEHSASQQYSFTHLKSVIKIPAVWLLMPIILCAYIGYKVTDIFSLYAREVMLYDEVSSAQVGTYLIFLRPLVGCVIGLLADRHKASTYLIYGFVVSIIGSTLFSCGLLTAGMNAYFLMGLFVTALGVYSTRVLYFAVMEEGKIPLMFTGTAVGLVSVIGYTPDIFAGPLIGYLLDNNPGLLGHQYVFMVLLLFSIIGLVVSVIFSQLHKENKQAIASSIT